MQARFKCPTIALLGQRGWSMPIKKKDLKKLNDIWLKKCKEKSCPILDYLHKKKETENADQGKVLPQDETQA